MISLLFHKQNGKSSLQLVDRISQPDIQSQDIHSRKQKGNFTFVWVIPLSGWASAHRSRTCLSTLRFAYGVSIAVPLHRSRTCLSTLQIAFGEVSSERRSPFGGNFAVQTTFLTAYRFRCHTISFLVVSSAELCLLHPDTRLFLIFLVPAIVTNTPLSPYTRICSMKRRSIAD